MKAPLILMLLLIGLNCFAQEPFVKVIEYKVQIKDLEADEFEWYRNNIEASTRIPWVQNLIDNVLKGNIKAYDPLNIDSSTPYTVEEIKNILYPQDTILVYDPVTGYETEQVIVRDFDASAVSHIKFREQWTWDNKKGLKKTVLGFSPLVDVYYNDDFMGHKTLFWIKY
jgi:hypothetical protein